MKNVAHFYILSAVLVFSSCAMLTKGTSAAGGAAAGAAIAGPSGAAIGGATGYLTAEIMTPEVSTPFEQQAPPEDLWGVLGLMVDRAYWLVILAGLAYLVALLLPPPNQWSIWSKIKDRFKK